MGVKGGSIDYVVDTYTTYKHPRFWLWTALSGTHNFTNGNATYKIAVTSTTAGYFYLYAKDNQPLFSYYMQYSSTTNLNIITTFNHKYVNFDSYCSGLNMLPTTSFSDTIPQIVRACYVSAPNETVCISFPVITDNYTATRESTDKPKYLFTASSSTVSFEIYESLSNTPNMFVILTSGSGIGSNSAIAFLDAGGEVVFSLGGYTNGGNAQFEFRKDLFDFSLICPDLYNKYPL